MPPTIINVTAPPGRLTPIGRSDSLEASGSDLCVSPGAVRRVRYSRDVRRAIARGDLIPCDMNGAECVVDFADADIEISAKPKANPPKVTQ